MNLEPSPKPAAQAGFLIHTFASTTFTQQTVDTAATERQGFEWYNWDFNGYRSDPNAVVINVDGSITLNGETGRRRSVYRSGVEMAAAPQLLDERFIVARFLGLAH